MRNALSNYIFRILVLACVPFAQINAAQPDGEALYVEHCAVCHGENGDGKSQNRGLTPPPRDFTTLRSAFELDRTRIYLSTSNGIEGTSMNAWNSRLSQGEIRATADYIYDRFVSKVKNKLPTELRTSLDTGEQLYMENCSVCHGDFGETGVWTRANMATAPRNFTTDRTKGELSRKRMIESITHGRAGKAMMAYGSRLTQTEISSIADYIRLALMALPVEVVMAEKSILEGSKKNAPSMEGLDFVNTEEFMSKPFPNGLIGDPNAGREIYVRNCFTCHGVKGNGQGPRAFFINPKPRNFISSDSRRALNRPKIYKAVHDGLPGSVMPAWSKVLSDQEVANAAEFVFRAFIRGDMPGVSEEDVNHSRLKKLISSSEGSTIESESLFDPTESLVEQGGPILTAHSYYPYVSANKDLPDHERGRAIYNYRCYFCHGYSGNAVTQAANFLDPKPRNFRKTDPSKLTREKMLEAVTLGKPDTAMKSFEAWLSNEEMELVVDFIRQEFMHNKASNTRYHTAANGWANHDRYVIAYPFATGELATDIPEEELTEQQREGLRLFMTTCVTCHDRGKVQNESKEWVPMAISYPRNGYSHRGIRPDAVSEASVFGKHDIKPEFDDLTEQQAMGEALFQDNCAFCHGMNGTGKNWIGSFLEPLPRNLTDPQQMAGMTPSRLTRAIEDGVKDTKMPAWKSVLTSEQIAALVAYIDKAFYKLEDE